MRKRLDICTTEPTRYEVALFRGGQVLYRYGFTARKTKKGILNLMTKDVSHLLTDEELEEADTFQLKYSRKHGLQVSSGISIRFTSATERDMAEA